MCDTAEQPCGSVRSGAVGLELSNAMPRAGDGNQPSTPARVVRTLDPAQVEKMGSAARFYQLNGPRFKKGLKKIG
jgi:hypothetical protein